MNTGTWAYGTANKMDGVIREARESDLPGRVIRILIVVQDELRNIYDRWRMYRENERELRRDMLTIVDALYDAIKDLRDPDSLVRAKKVLGKYRKPRDVRKLEAAVSNLLFTIQQYMEDQRLRRIGWRGRRSGVSESVRGNMRTGRSRGLLSEADSLDPGSKPVSPNYARAVLRDARKEDIRIESLLKWLQEIKLLSGGESACASDLFLVFDTVGAVYLAAGDRSVRELERLGRKLRKFSRRYRGEAARAIESFVELADFYRRLILGEQISLREVKRVLDDADRYIRRVKVLIADAIERDEDSVLCRFLGRRSDSVTW